MKLTVAFELIVVAFSFLWAYNLDYINYQNFSRIHFSANKREKLMLVECPNCEAFVDGEHIADYTDYEVDSDMTGKYTFLKCPRCSRPFIMLR